MGDLYTVILECAKMRYSEDVVHYWPMLVEKVNDYSIMLVRNQVEL
jgi:hypothetical protein